MRAVWVPCLIIACFSEALAQQPGDAEKQRQERQAGIEQLKEDLAPLLEYDIDSLRMALTLKIWEAYNGAAVYSDEQGHKFLGIIASSYDLDSIFNEYGTYGSEFSLDSVWNEFGTYGSEFSVYSPMNGFSSYPPLIVVDGKIVARLTVNENLAGAIDPYWLRFFFAQ